MKMRTFEQWKAEVDLECIRQTGMDTEALPDYDYMKAFGNCMSVKQTVKAVIKNAKGY